MSDEQPTADYTRPPEIAKPMAIGRIITIVAVSSIVCAVLGTGLGLLIGAVLPEIYQTFSTPEVHYDPIRIGMALGFSQGLIAGFVFGIVIVLVQAFGRRY